MKLEATNPAQGRSTASPGTRSRAAQEYTITSAPEARAEEFSRRRTRYLVQMGIRVVCVVLLFFVPKGWPMVLVAIGAVVLPYIAVVGANAGVEMTKPGEMAQFQERALGNSAQGEGGAPGATAGAEGAAGTPEPVVIVLDASEGEQEKRS